jgi:hypothetical protein
VSDNPFIVRQATPDDVSFVFSSWLKSFRDAATVKGVPSGLYYPAQHAVIEGILQRQCCTALVACDPQDPSQIYGYVVAEYVGEGLVIHFTYTKFNMRNLGIAKALVTTLVVPTIKFVQFSHRTRAVDTLDSKLTAAGFVFNPYTR